MLTDWSALSVDNTAICSSAGRKETVINWPLINANSFLREFVVSLKTLDWDIQTDNALHQIKNVFLLEVGCHVWILLISFFLTDTSEVWDSLNAGIMGLIWCYRKWKTSAEPPCGSRWSLLVIGWITIDFMPLT